MIPTLFGIMVVSFVIVQFAPGGPVEQVIAQMSGQNISATERITGSEQGDFAGQQTGEAKSTSDVNSTYRGARGLRPEILERIKKQFGFDKPAY